MRLNSIAQTITTLMGGRLCTERLALPMVTSREFESTVLAVKGRCPRPLDDEAICRAPSSLHRSGTCRLTLIILKGGGPIFGTRAASSPASDYSPIFM